MSIQQCKAQAELTMERALFKKEREMQELLRQGRQRKCPSGSAAA